MEYKYDAFISYRHRERDMAVAKKLQKLLESLKKKDGSKLRIFLDTTELSCATSVEGALRKELEQSRYLIVICSPDYKDPKKKDKKKRDYCKEELNYFLQLRGNNNNILTVLVEGEPDDSFPDELLQYREETGLDQSGNPVKVRVEMDPLAADVRGGALNDQLKKLKVEYLQIAAPLLDVEFDQLYQREHRRELRKRSVMIAGLLALLIYSLIMIFQISQRQRLLEAKQQELYQNESIRLANEAMLLMEEDPGLARMLAHTALPANLQEPDYPVTQEAEISIRTAALQHMYAEAAAPFTPIARVAFSNTHWGFGVICGDGNYFSVVDSVQTRVYESRTGRLIGVFPSREVFFFEGADRCVYESSRMLENGEWWSGYSVCDLWTGEELWRIDAYVTPDMDVQEGDPVFEYLEYEKETGRLWVVLSGYTDPLGPPPADEVYWDAAYGWFDREGVFHEDHTIPDARGSFVTVFYNSRGDRYAESNLLAGLDFEHRIRWDDLPEDYRRVVDAVESELNAAGSVESFEADIISKCMDGALYILGGNIYSENSLYVVWSAEAERMIWSDEDACCLDSDTGLLYCIKDYEIQIYESNPENFGLPQTGDSLDHVSDNGVYGFKSGYLSLDDAHAWSLCAYDMSKRKDAVRGEKELLTGDILEKGAYRYTCDASCIYDVTSDGSRLVILEEDNRISFADIANGELLFRVDTAEQNICDIAINEDGTLFAYAVSSDDAADIFLREVDTWKIVGWKHFERPDSWHPTYLEIRNGRLLALDSERTEFRIYSLEDVDRDPRRIQPSSHGAEIRLSSNRRILTADGLLIIPGSRSSFYADRTDTVSEIFDTETCEKIDFYSFYTEDDQDYYYDAVGGYLILQYMDEFYIQRRGASGDFEVVYVIVSQHDNMIIDGSSSICDGTWLVLQSEEFCEIYRLEDGTLCYSFRKLDGRDCQIGVIDGQLYDFCMGWNRVSIPLLDTEEASMYIRDVLSRDGFRRILTDQEMQEYYVPSHWREKA